MVFLEAMACGLPVVARGVGVVPELVDRDADVVLAEDPDGFARGIGSVLGASSSRNREISRAYDWENVVDAWEEVYEEARA